MGALIEHLREGLSIVRIHPDLGNEHRLQERAPQGTDPTEGGTTTNDNPADLPQNYSLVDNIERDHEVHCYHWPVPGHKESTVGYRKCYHKDEPCNVRWRDDVRAFRANCAETLLNDLKELVAPNPSAPICGLMWEPDVESASYCEGKEVAVGADGNRILPCGPAAGIGLGAKCPAPILGGACTKWEDCEVLEPDTTSTKCKGVWSACEENFVQVCVGSLMPCQSKCGDPDTCERGYPTHVLPNRAPL